MNSIKKEFDELPIVINDNLAKATMQYINEGTTLGIKASLNIENKELVINAEKLTFINTK